MKWFKSETYRVRIKKTRLRRKHRDVEGEIRSERV